LAVPVLALGVLADEGGLAALLLPRVKR
jgi:hypothetical protein